MPDFKIDIGNSTEGLIGAVIYVENVADKEAALAHLKADCPHEIHQRTGANDYIDMGIYINTSDFNLEDIEECD